MKTKKINTKLVLNKKTVANLGFDEMDVLRGGAISPCTRVDQTCERACLTDVTCFPHTCSCVTYYEC